jgi:hypothetical protein
MPAVMVRVLVSAVAGILTGQYYHQWWNNRGSCGTVTIGGVVGAISTSPYTYQP